MRTMRELLPKPSDAVQAMIDGLIENGQRDDFKISMATFGDERNGICCGCAATCAVMKATGVRFDTDSIGEVTTRSKHAAIELQDLNEFEGVINWLRLGNIELLFAYYGVPFYVRDRVPKPLFRMHWDWNWRDEISLVRQWLERLRSLGL